MHFDQRCKELEDVVDVGGVAAEAEILKTVLAAAGDGGAGKDDAWHHDVLRIRADVGWEAQSGRVDALTGPCGNLGKSRPGTANIQKHGRRNGVNILQRCALGRAIEEVALGDIIEIVIFVLGAITVVEIG